MLFKKMLRDLSDYKFQFISIFLLAFLGAFLFTGINAEEIGLETSISNKDNSNELDTDLLKIKDGDNSIYQSFANAGNKLSTRSPV